MPIMKGKIMNTLSTKKKDNLGYLSITLASIVSDPGQFINDGAIQSHNAPNEERMKLVLIRWDSSSNNYRTINLVFDMGVGGNPKKYLYSISIDDAPGTRAEILGLANFASAANCSEADIRQALYSLNAFLNESTIATCERDDESLAEYEQIIKEAICDPDNFIRDCKTLAFNSNSETHIIEDASFNHMACQIRISRVGDLVSIDAYLYGASEPVYKFGTHDQTKRLISLSPESDTLYLSGGIEKLIQYAKDYKIDESFAESEKDTAIRYLSEKIDQIILWHDFQGDEVTNPDHIDAGWGNENDGVYDFFDCLNFVIGEAPPKLNASMFLGDEITASTYLDNLDRVTLQIAIGGPNAALVLILDHKSEPDYWLYVFENEINYRGSLAISEAIGEDYKTRVRPALDDFAENLMSYIRC